MSKQIEKELRKASGKISSAKSVVVGGCKCWRGDRVRQCSIKFRKGGIQELTIRLERGDWPKLLYKKL